MRRLIQANLEAYGLEVRTAVNGTHGLQVLDAGAPDLILLDTDVPGAKLDHLIARLHGQAPSRVPIIVLSAELPSPQSRQDGTEITYLLKPFAVPNLLEQVRRVLERSLPE